MKNRKVLLHMSGCFDNDSKGEHTGDFFGIPPKGNNFSYQAAHISRIADDKLMEHKGDSMKI